MMARILLRLLKWVGFTLAGLVALVVVLLVVVQTGPGKSLLARVASSLASVSGLRIEIAEITGGVPWNMTIARIAVDDPNGPVAQVDNLHLAWSPLALLGGVLNVEAITADRVALERLPELAPSEDTTESSSSSSFMLPVRLGRLAIADIEIGEPVAGLPARLSLNASADLMASGPGLSANFDLHRKDAPGDVSGKVSYVPQTRILDVNIQANEPPGGLVARLAGMEGLPELKASITGNGPIDAWDGHLNLSAGDVAQMSGAAGVRAVAQGHRVTVGLDADVARLLPSNIAPLLEGRTELASTVLAQENGLLDVESFSLRAAGFGAAAKGMVDFEGTGSNLAYSAVLGDAARFAELAPGVAWKSVKLDGALKGKLAQPSSSSRLEAVSLSGMGYGVGTLTVDAKTAPDAANAALQVVVDGHAQGLTADDRNVRSALGDSASFNLTASVPEAGDAALTGFVARLAALDARFTGTASAKDADGVLDMERLDLAAFAPLAGQSLSGTARLKAKVEASDSYEKLTLTLDGGTDAVKTGISAVDNIFGKTSRLSGALRRTGAEDFAVEKLALEAEGLELTADGNMATSVADLKTKLVLDDLKRVDPRLSGRLNAGAIFSGGLDDLGVSARVTVPEGTAMGQKMEGLSLNLRAHDLTGLPSGDFKLDGRIANNLAQGGGAFAMGANGAARLEGLDLAIGSVSAKGDVARGEDGLFAGKLAVMAGNLADLSALALTELAGKLNANIDLGAANGVQSVTVKANADGVRAAGQSIGSARIDATVTDPTGQLVMNGDVELANINAGVSIPHAKLVARGQGKGTALQLNALVDGMDVTGAAQLNHSGSTSQVRLERLRAARGRTAIATTAPATLTIDGGEVQIDRLALASSGGSVAVSGKAGSVLDLKVDIRNLPLALAELAAPGLGLAGTVSGDAVLKGAAATPDGTYNIRVNGLSTADIASAGAGPFNIRTEGTLGKGRVNTRTVISSRRVSDLTIAGSVPMGAGDMDLAIKGMVDLAIANPSLATTGSQLSGTARIDATFRGTPQAPRAGGTIRLSNGRFLSSEMGITLNQIEGVITGTERTVTVTSLTARTPNGGTIAAKGHVALDPAGNFPGRVEVAMHNAGLINSELIRLVTQGTVAVDGQFTNGPKLVGRLQIKDMDVNIAERIPGGVQAMEVRDVHDRRGKNAARLAPTTPSNDRGPGAKGIDLDVIVDAPNNIFVRGMGMEAELGGRIKVTGTSHAPVTDGGFEMRRGQFDIVGRRLNFTRGKITFTGSTDPELDFVAETTANDITARIMVNGPASKPEITFGSTPTLPQDEVVSRLLFGRSASSLSATQALQLAQAMAQFSSGGNGVVDQMRRSLGLDNLELGTDSTGKGGQVGIGKRINDRVYMGVRQGTTPASSKVTVDVDVTRNIRLQGATGADGNTTVGIGAQWDY
ncbi:MAG: translocation/assembly module TamB domain-containing protein [Xanthobacter sp.]